MTMPKGLTYVTSRTLSVKRIGTKPRFRYINARGKAVRNPKQLQRIHSLVLPPAWKDVRICASPIGHLQAVGRDARGRLQYRYHPKWRQVRDESKYHRLIDFARELPRLRKIVTEDLGLPGLPKRKVLATIVKLLETTLIRVGNEEYAKENGSYGLTTLLDRHVKIEGKHLCFSFKGKSGIRHDIELSDARLARIVKKCRDLPGQELFQYVDEEGKTHDIGSSDVNDYLRETLGEDFTAKDFRTWAGTVLAARALKEFQEFNSKAEANRNIVRAIEEVAKRLGNTRAVCKKCYVHPAVLDAYVDGALLSRLEKSVNAELRDHLHALTPEEAAVLALLRQNLKAAH